MLVTSSILSRRVGMIIGSKLLIFLDALSLSNGSRVSCPHKSSWSVLCFHDDFSCLGLCNNRIASPFPAPAGFTKDGGVMWQAFTPIHTTSMQDRRGWREHRQRVAPGDRLSP